MKLLDWLLGARPGKQGFHGGLHLPAHKAMSTRQPAQAHPLEARYLLSLRQRDGNWLEPLVSEGEHVLRGQALAQPSTPAGLMLHAPTSGSIHAIIPQPDIHRSGELALSIILKADGQDRALPPLPPLDEKHPPALLRERLAFCGIAGLGGAGFPAARKLAHQAAILLVNAAECEPYISCDDMQIRQEAPAIVRGAQLAAHIIGAERIIFGIEDDKPQAIAALQAAIAHSGDARISLSVVPVRYPSGNSRQLIELTLGRRLPADAHAADAGIICHNSATLKAVHDALLLGIPLTERYLTISGEGIETPQNRIVRIGTPIAALAAAAGGQKAGSRLLIGGPMMGEPQQSQAAGIGKTTNCLLFLPRQPERAAGECIRCARCSDACPVSLMPQQLYWYSRNLDSKKLAQYRLFDCIECGICASVCPAEIPLVQYYRDSKAALRQSARDHAAAERAKARHEAREARLAREAAERQAKMQAKREALQARSSTASPQEGQRMADAALAAKREAHLANTRRHPGNFDPTTGTRSMPNPAQSGLAEQALPPEDSAKQSAIEAAKARAAAKRAARRQALSPEEQAAAEKDAKLSAARAKAAARKAARAGDSEEAAAPAAANPTALNAGQSEDKQQAIEAAKARAAAKRAARMAEADSAAAPQAANLSHSSDAAQTPDAAAIAETPQQSEASADVRDAKLAAARAKAARAGDSGEAAAPAAANPPALNAGQSEDKQQAIEAAKARAAAKRAARMAEADSAAAPQAANLSYPSDAAHTPDAAAIAETPQQSEASADVRDAKLAAARAKAAARKAARAEKSPSGDSS